MLQNVIFQRGISTWIPRGKPLQIYVVSTLKSNVVNKRCGNVVSTWSQRGIVSWVVPILNDS